jgi:small subunit ribosomal protein S17
MEQNKRNLIGTVVSDKMQKTAVVEVTRTRRHSRYLKLFKVTKRFKCHNEDNLAKVGNTVVIEETRPMSREKRWKIVKILSTTQPKTESVSQGQ